MTSADIAPPDSSGNKRFFYTDPLAAAWMAQQFGMRFDDDALLRLDKIGDRYNPSASIVCSPEELAKSCANDYVFKAYVHPDSLTLLELQVGDLVTIQDITSIYTKEDFELDQQAENEGLKDDFSPYKIILRNGIPFMWPESEAA